MLNAITQNDWQPALAADGIVGGLDDIEQCIRIILMTPKNSDPHRPDFGCDLYRYVDWPINQATPHIVRDARDAILKYEKRVKDLKFSFVPSVDGTNVVVEWLPAAGGDWQRTVVPLAVATMGAAA